MKISAALVFAALRFESGDSRNAEANWSAATRKADRDIQVSAGIAKRRVHKGRVSGASAILSANFMLQASPLHVVLRDLASRHSIDGNPRRQFSSASSGTANDNRRHPQASTSDPAACSRLLCLRWVHKGAWECRRSSVCDTGIAWHSFKVQAGWIGCCSSQLFEVALNTMSGRWALCFPRRHSPWIGACMPLLHYLSSSVQCITWCPWEILYLQDILAHSPPYSMPR